MADFGSLLLSAYVGLTRVARPLGAGIVKARLRKGKEDPDRFRERCGETGMARPQGRPLVWVHAVSVGESVSAVPLIDRLAAQGFAVVVTTVTTTSAAVLAGRLPGQAVHQFAPLDFAPFVDRFIAHWRPALALFVESEIWPVTIARLDAAGIPLVIANARLSERSARGWGRFSAFAGAVFSRIALVLAQSDGDADRFRSLGTADARVTGNIKLDAESPEAAPADAEALAGAVGSRPVLLAASTHPGEDEIVIDAFERIRLRLPEALLLLAPRHPARGAAVAELPAGRFTVARRSLGELPDRETAVYVADSMGELGSFYRLASVALVGGTMVPGIGGHNPIEPVRLGVAVLSGPHSSNWPDIHGALRASGGIAVVEDAESLAAAAVDLLVDPLRRARQRVAAEAVLAERGGALERSIAALEPRLAALRGGAG